MSVRWIFLLFVVALSACHVNGLYSHKCKEAETKADTIGRFLENANCTLTESRRKFQSGLQQMQNNVKLGFDNFKKKFVKTTQKPLESTTKHSEALDYNIDVRMMTEDDAKLTTRSKRDGSDEGKREVS